MNKACRSSAAHRAAFPYSHLALWLLAAGAAGGLLPARAATAEDAAAEPSARAEGVAFFESKIRPVLVEHCYGCHSAEAKSVKGQLLLDSRAGIRKGGESGPAVVAGSVEESLIVGALRHETFEMPPSGKLPEQVIADVVRWIEMGAPDPREGNAAASPARREIDVAEGRRFWSFQPISLPRVPAVDDASWPKTDIDRFILHQIEEAGESVCADADRRTLLRRLSFDLLGLPPTRAEIEAFLSDESPDALAAVVDRMLESPHFGERWGRYWLDLARFSESTGGGRSMLYGPAWRYRDYVIASYNADKPFDEFIVEQIAGDLLSSDDYRQRREQLTATAFLALGPTNYELQDKRQLEMDVIDEQIDTIGKVFLGMTIGCARCHDHKFDPIPTADYYAMAGIFDSTHTLVHSNVSTWVTAPLPPDPQTQRKIEENRQRMAAVAEEMTSIEEEMGRLQSQLPVITFDDEKAEFTGTWTDSTYSKKYVGERYRHSSIAGSEATFTIPVKTGRYDVRVSYSAASNRAKNARILIDHQGGQADIRIDQTKVPPMDGLFVSLGEFRFADEASVTFTTRDVQGVLIVDAVQLAALEVEGVEASDAAAIVDKLDELQTKYEELKKEKAGLAEARPRLPDVIAVEDQPKPANIPICIRGNVQQLGEKVPRGFLSVVSWDGQPRVPEDASGRLQLARWIADPHNPLTARVYVNRIWHHLLGRGIVRTVDNFGSMGEAPSHPELLDYLASRFIEQGYSTKGLIRQIVLSRVYQLSSERRAESVASDPENRLLTGQNRRRLDAESIHDAMLAVSGELDRTIGGNTIRANTKSEYDYEFDVGRRAVYLPVFRNQLPDLFAVFDFADPNQPVGRRTSSTLSTQALYMMNSPFVMDRSASCARRLLAMELDDASRIEVLFERALGRPPTSAERELALGQVSAGDRSAREQRWAELCQAVFGSVDFRYLE